MTMTRCAFVETLTVNRPATLSVKCKSPTEVSVTQNGFDLFRHTVITEAVARIYVTTPDPVHIKAGEFSSTIIPVVLPCPFNYLRVRRLGRSGPARTISWGSNAHDVTLQLIGDQLSE